MGRLRIQPNSGQQTDFSDEYYLKRHAQGEALERKGRKQERDRLVIERNRIKHRVEQLKLEVASASFYANPSPIKPPPPSFVGNIGSSSSTSSPFTAAVGGSRHSTPVVSERMRESERNKRRQLQEAEETLRRYDELLQPREPYVPFSADAANGTAGNANTAPRTWLTGGKGKQAGTGLISHTVLMNHAPPAFYLLSDWTMITLAPLRHHCAVRVYYPNIQAYPRHLTEFNPLTSSMHHGEQLSHQQSKRNKRNNCKDEVRRS